MIAFVLTIVVACKDKQETNASVAGTTETKAPVELLDSTMIAPVKSSFDAFTKADVDGFTATYDDNVKLVWSSGDSLVGKQAVKDYYNGRWKLLESVSFSNDIFLPIQANVSPNNSAPVGKWMLHWVQVNAKYKNGKAITFWLHNASHYGENGKVDYIAQYIDRLPLVEATKDMMK